MMLAENGDGQSTSDEPRATSHEKRETSHEKRRTSNLQPNSQPQIDNSHVEMLRVLEAKAEEGTE